MFGATSGERKQFGAVLSNALVLLFTVSSASGQQGTSLGGEVRNENGQPINGAVIELQRTDFPAHYRVRSGLAGQWSFSGLPVGSYNVTCTFDGNVIDRVDGIRSKPGETVTVKCHRRKAEHAEPELEPRGIQQTIQDQQGAGGKQTGTHAQLSSLLAKTLADAKAFRSAVGSPDQRTQLLIGMQLDTLFNGLEQSQRIGSITTSQTVDPSRGITVPPTSGTIQGGARGVGFYMKQEGVRGQTEWTVLCGDVVTLLHSTSPRMPTNIYCPGATEPAAPARVAGSWPDPTNIVRSFSHEPVGIPLDGYHVPGLIALLYASDLAKIPDDINTRGYVASFLLSYNRDQHCPQSTDAGWEQSSYVFHYEILEVQRTRDVTLPLTDDNVNQSFAATLQMLDQAARSGAVGGRMRQDGLEDGKTFVSRYGCNDTRTKKIVDTMNAVVTQRVIFAPDVPNNAFFRAQTRTSDAPAFSYSDNQSRMGRKVRQACEAISGTDDGRVGGPEESKCRCVALMLIQSRVPDEMLDALVTHYDYATLESIAEKYPSFKTQWPVCR